MAINLDKHKNELLEAWRDVLDDKTDTDWALFSYEGQTNDLKVTGTGSGGIEELVEDLNSGKVMYAFVKVNDPKTSLPKCVLINWQGEGANTVRKGICANHLRDVERFFKGANLTLNARTEDEVDVQIVHDKLAKAGSSYSFKAPRGDSTGPKAPIGSNYKPINPLAEINSLERDQFWMRQEQEERDRVAQEAERREAERRRQEEEVRRRDAVEAERRDEVTKRRNSSIDEIKRAEVNAVEHERHNSIVEEVFSTEAKVNQSDLLRQQRNQEAQNLIAQRTIDARSIFERNTSAGQIKKTPEKPVRTSILKAQQQQQKAVEEETAVQKVEVVQAKQTEESDDEGDQFATIKRSPKDVEAKKTGSVMSPTIEQHETLKVGLQENNLSNKTEPVQQITEQQFVDEVLYGDIVDSGIQARALYDYQAADDTEITFDPGDVITHIELVDEGWWQGLGPDGTYGLFPANYVEII